MSRSRHFTFTNFDLTISPDQQFPDYTYLVYQIERCPTSGKLHQQGAVSFKYQKSLSALVKLWKGPHYEIATNMLASRNYCKKSDSRVEGPYEFTEKSSKEPECNVYKSYVSDIKLARQQATEQFGLNIEHLEQLSPILDHKYFHAVYDNLICE